MSMAQYAMADLTLPLLFGAGLSHLTGSIVMAWLDPAIHASPLPQASQHSTRTNILTPYRLWAERVVNARVKPRHDNGG